MTVLAVVAFSFLRMTSVQGRTIGHEAASGKAFWVAEAGLKKYFYLLKNDSNYRDNYPPLNENLVDGSYSVSATYDAGSTTYTITSEGQAGPLTRKIRQSTVVSEGSDAFQYTIFVFGGHVAFDNTIGTINGDVGASGDVQAVGALMTINGIVTPNAAENGPYAPDFDGYRSIADNIVGGHKTFVSGQTYGSPGAEEVWFIEGKATIEGNATIYGSVIAPNMTIDMDNASNVTIASASGMPALVGGSYIEIQNVSNSTINGLIYCAQDLRCNNWNDVTVNGSMIAENVFNLQNGVNIQINYDTGLLTDPPPYFTEYTSGGTTVTLQNDWEELQAS